MSHFVFNKMAQHHATTRDIRSYIDESLPGQLIGRRTSHTLTWFNPPPSDFYFRGSLKDLVHGKKPQTLGRVTGRNWNVLCLNASGNLGHSCSCTSPPNSEVCIDYCWALLTLHLVQQVSQPSLSVYQIWISKRLFNQIFCTFLEPSVFPSQMWIPSKMKGRISLSGEKFCRIW